ncbi:MAG: LptF/LptG family permease [Proteobacteria bacterium]|nr:LptF/LptG family permease [Pseudomonadota bacterium]
MKPSKRINLYIANHFLIKFLQITLGFSLLIFFINFLENVEKVRDSEVPIYITSLMAFLQIPDFLNEIAPSLVLISSIITFFLLSGRSEITIIRSSGFSMWQVLRPMAMSALILGIFWVLVFNPISVLMTKKFNNLEAEYVKKERREMLVPSNGIWLKQNNIDKDAEEIVIQAKKVYKTPLELDEVTMWFFENNGQFYQKIDAKKMFLKGDLWELQDVTINDQKNLNKKQKTYEVPTNLESDFIIQTIINNFQNVKLFSIFELPSLIQNLQSSGFSSVKFKVYLNSLLSKPFLFLAMTLIACYFGINHNRNNKSIFLLFIGITLGLILYITAGVIGALGSSGLIPVFASTWTIAIICLAIGTLLIYRKEKF